MLAYGPVRVKRPETRYGAYGKRFLLSMDYPPPIQHNKDNRSVFKIRGVTLLRRFEFKNQHDSYYDRSGSYNVNHVSLLLI